MIRRIKSHNTVNGIAFAISEFALMALLVAPLGVAWALTNHPLYALATFGFVANCLCVVVIGVQAWRAGERGYSLRRLFNGAHRARLMKEHPAMSEDTLAILVGTLVPFALAVLTLVDYSRSRTR
ncbi:MAG TPA: hypothetical protein VIJ91_03195 [Candidatus Dormibacteraeota bacterium]